MNIYIPEDNYVCVTIKDSDTIRAYKNQPQYNSTADYTDYFVNSHYISQSGTQQFNQYSTLPTCLDNTKITDNVFYRFDMPDILLMFFIIIIFCFYFPYRIIGRMFGRWLKI